MSFRKQLHISLLLLSLLPIMIISGIAMYMSIDALTDSRRTALISATEATAQKVGNFISTAKHDLLILAQNRDIRRFAGDAGERSDVEKNDVIDELLKTISYKGSYTGAFVIDGDGAVIASTFPVHGDSNYSNSDIFARVINSDPAYVNIHVIDETDGALSGIFVFSALIDTPDGDDPAVLALVSGAETFNELKRNDETHYKSSTLYLADMSGKIMYYAKLSGNAYLYDVGSQELAQGLLNGTNPPVGMNPYKFEGKRYISAYSHLEDMDFILMILIDESELYMPTTIFLALMFGLIALVTVLVTLLVRRLSLNMMNPIAALQDAFYRAGQNRIYAPCNTVRGSLEFVELAEGFNTMIKHINKHQSDTEKALESLRISEDELRRHNSMLRLERDRVNLLINKDSITGAYSRLHFERVLEVALKLRRPGAVIIIDIDDFKHINDSFGYQFGDKCLKALGEALSSEEFKSEAVARISADEFIMLVPGLKTEAKQCARKIHSMLQKPFVVENIYVRMHASIGVALFPQDGNEVEELFKNADLASAQAKAWGKNQVCFYQPSMATLLKTQLEILEMLRTAHSKGNAYLVYQPEVDLKTGQVYAFEALCRSKSETLGLVSPVEFIPLAESSGLIVPLGEWILKQACKFAKSVLDGGIDINYVSVNISQVQINQESFVDLVLETLKETELPPHKLQLEITEGVLSHSAEMVITKLTKLSKQGVIIALDDFGTGYSSLNYLVNLPIETVKIDKSLIDNIDNNERTRIAYEAVIKLGHKLGLKIVAEGAETEKQIELLKDMNCDLVQGFYYSRPVYPDDAADYARDRAGTGQGDT